MLIAIEGGGYDPQPTTFPVYGATSVSNPETARSDMGVSVSDPVVVVAPESAEVRGLIFRPALLSAQVRTQIYAEADMSVALGVRIELLALQAVEVVNGPSMLLLADVLETALADLLTVGPHGYYPGVDITAELLVAGVALPIRSFEYQEPPNKLGAILNIALSRPTDFSAVPYNADIIFRLLITDPSTSSVRAINLVADGKIGGREYAIQWSAQADGGPGDVLSIATLDAIADKFGLAPRRPVIMFDPLKVHYKDVEFRPTDALLDDKGHLIKPILEPVGGLTMLQALQRAYTDLDGYAFSGHLSAATLAEFARIADLINGGGASAFTIGLGFNHVVTNIPNYPISRADFTVEGGWQQGAEPFVAMYGPLYFTIGGDLCVIYAARKLPYAYTPRYVDASNYARLGLALPYREPYNAVLLTYQLRGYDFTDGLIIRIEVEQRKDESGQYGVPGYTEILTYDRYLRKYDADNNKVFEALQEHKVETYVADSFGVLYLAHRETQQDFYADDLKTGHHKVVEGLMLTGPTAATELIEVLIEDCTIAWADNPSTPGQMIQRLNITEIQGLVYDSTDTKHIIDPTTGVGADVPIRYSALAAQKNGLIEDDGTLIFASLKTIIETLRATTGTALDVSVVEIDHISGTINRSITQPRTGTTSVNQYKVRSHTRLLRDTESEAAIGPRIPRSLNTGELPYKQALELGQDVLALGNDPAEGANIIWPGYDPRAQKGSVLVGVRRDGSHTPQLLVQGLTVTGSNLGQQGHHIGETLDCVELPT